MSTRYDMELPDLQAYRPELAEPADFDEFWRTTLEENPFDPALVRVDEVETPLETLRVLDLVFPGFGSDPIRAWLTLPVSAEGPLPAVVQYQGYGGGRGLPVDHLDWASAGFAHFFMDSRGQGGTWGNGGATPDPRGAGYGDQGFMTRGIEDPRDHYYRRIYIDAHHAVEAAAALPQVDASKILVTGGSQGGALAIAAASLNHRVVGAMPDVPFMNHFRRSVAQTEGTPYDEIVRYLAVFRDRVDRVFETLSYFDGVLLGRRALAPALFSTALLDSVCPPSSVFAARNWWGAAAEGEAPRADIEVYPFNNHEGGGAYQWLKQVDWARGLLGDGE